LQNQARKCRDHRTISLISHTGKIVARILSKRLGSKIEEVIEEDQFGFRKVKGTRDTIGLMSIISESVLKLEIPRLGKGLLIKSDFRMIQLL